MEGNILDLIKLQVISDSLAMGMLYGLEISALRSYKLLIIRF